MHIFCVEEFWWFVYKLVLKPENVNSHIQSSNMKVIVWRKSFLALYIGTCLDRGSTVVSLCFVLYLNVTNGSADGAWKMYIGIKSIFSKIVGPRPTLEVAVHGKIFCVKIYRGKHMVFDRKQKCSNVLPTLDNKCQRLECLRWQLFALSQHRASLST